MLMKIDEENGLRSDVYLYDFSCLRYSSASVFR